MRMAIIKANTVYTYNTHAYLYLHVCVHTQFVTQGQHIDVYLYMINTNSLHLNQHSGITEVCVQPNTDELMLHSTSTV